MESKANVKFESVWLPENNTSEGSADKSAGLLTETIFVKSEPVQEDDVLADEHLIESEPAPDVENEVKRERSPLRSLKEGKESIVPAERKGPYSCEVCGAMFEKLHDIAEHIESYCGDRPFKCKLCGRRVRNLNVHKHSRDPVKTALFRCDVCQRTFMHLGTMMRHKRTHPKCDACGRTFEKQSSLVEHMELHKCE